jgi:putative RecB family exonuclease
MPRYSHSKIECFRHCPRQFYYRYVKNIKLPDEPEHIPTFFGSRVHDALEWLYDQVKNGIVPTERQAITEFGRVWDANWSDDIVIHERRMTPQRYRSLGEKCVTDYYTKHYPFDDSTTIQLEQRIGFDLDEKAGITMTGFIDRLATTPDGVWHIHDYKTNKQLPSQAEMDTNPQLAYYEIGIRQMWPKIKTVELHWHFVRFGETITSTRTPVQLNQLREDALETILEAQGREKNEEAYETHETGLCDYCGFQSICPVKKHVMSVEDLPTNRYRSEPGVKLVNRWTELKEKKADLSAQVAEIDEEIAEIQDALVEYAEREGVSVVVGDDHESTIRRSDRIMFPRKTSEHEDYTQLEQRLAESPFWDMVSSMDISQLRSLWKHSDTVDKDLSRILREYVWTEEEVKVRLRKRRIGEA